jgi:hypothetical protein
MFLLWETSVQWTHLEAVNVYSFAALVVRRRFRLHGGPRLCAMAALITGVKMFIGDCILRWRVVLAASVCCADFAGRFARRAQRI